MAPERSFLQLGVDSRVALVPEADDNGKQG